MSRPRRLLTIVAVVVLCAIPALAFLSGRVGGIADADFLFLHELIPSLAHGGSLAHWRVPYATYMLPDWPLYALALAIGTTPAMSIALFAWLQFLLLAGAIFLVARAVDPRRAGLITVVALAGVVLAVQMDAFPLVYLAASYVHGGSAVFGVAMLGLLVSWQREPSRWILLATSVLTFAACVSDRLFVTWALAPACAMVLLLAWLEPERRRRHLTWLLAQAGAFFVALPIPGLLFPNRSGYDLSIGFQPSFGMRRFRTSIDLVQQLSPWLVPVVVLATVVSAVLLIGGRSLFGQALPGRQRLVIAGFAVISALLTVSSQVAMVGEVPPHARYSTILFLLPLVIAPVLATAGFSEVRTSIPRTAAALLVLAPVVIAVGYPASWIGKLNTNQQARPIACVEHAIGRGETHGISSYWDARQYQVFSKGRLKMSEFGPDLKPMLVNSNEAELAPSYDFAIVSGLFGSFDLPPDRLEVLAGTPKRTTVCGAWSVLDYGPGGLTLDPFRKVGAKRTFTGCMLGTHIGTVTPSCRLEVDRSPAEDYLVFGPYVTAPSGRYRITVDYRSTMAAGEKVGTWDVTQDAPGEQVVARVRCAAPAGGPAPSKPTSTSPAAETRACSGASSPPSAPRSRWTTSPSLGWRDRVNR